MKNTLILIDAGNSFFKILSIIDGKKQFKRLESVIQVCEYLKKSKLKPGGIALISSVVSDKQTKKIIKLLNGSGLKVHRLKNHVRTLFNSNYNFTQMGEDRVTLLTYCLLSNLAPCITVDAGTAIKIDFLDYPNNISGGYICAGINSELRVLHEKTALLPELTINGKLSKGLPLDTSEAIRTGVIKTKVLGVKTLIENFLAQTDDRKHWKIIITGGDGFLFKKEIRDAKIIPELVLEGLKLVAQSQLLR